jgi:phasin
MKIMDEATTTAKTKSKPVSGPMGSAFEFPKFEMPNYEMPKFEVPGAFREFVEKSVSQAKETYEKIKSAAEQATDVLEDTYTSATRGAADYGLKVIEATRANTNATFDFCSQLMTAKSYSDVIELSTAHTRKQFDAFAAQSKDLAALAQKVAIEAAGPVKESVSKTFSKAS